MYDGDKYRSIGKYRLIVKFRLIVEIHSLLKITHCLNIVVIVHKIIALIVKAFTLAIALKHVIPHD